MGDTCTNHRGDVATYSFPMLYNIIGVVKDALFHRGVKLLWKWREGTVT